MNSSPLLTTLTVFAAVVGLCGRLAAWEPGTYPTSPARMPSRGFVVNNQDRADVVAFWQAIYQASEGYEKRVKWTGDYSGNNGTTSAEFADDVERRLNYFRAMCGISSDVRVTSTSTVVIDSTDAYKPSASTLKAAAVQSAALMLARNYNPMVGTNPALSHYPPAGLVGWSSTSWNANAKGNFAFGLYGPGAITEYMIEQLSRTSATSSWNSLVGHRRWTLFPRATTFASGDQPGTSASQPPSNVLYVVQKESEMLGEETVPRFVAYPSAGFFPAKINSPFWSLSCHGADFSAAVVKMTDAAGNAVPIIATRRSADYGDPAVVWEVDPSAAVQSVAKDTVYTIKVSGIAGTNIPESWNYAVTLIDPDVLTFSQKISGGSSQKTSVKGVYTFTPPVGSDGLQVVACRTSKASWTEDAENTASARVIDRTGGNYALMVNPSVFSGFGPVAGKSSFHLTFPTSYDLLLRGVPDQIFELDHELIPTSKGVVTFQYRRGFMTRNSFLAVEASKDGGVTWKAIGSTLAGVSDTQMDSSTSAAKFAIPASTYPQRIRFRYYTKGGAIYTHDASPKSATGIFIDQISTSGCQEYFTLKSNTYSAATKKFVLSSTTAGTKLAAGEKLALRLRYKLGGKWFPMGPAKSVAIVAP